MHLQVVLLQARQLTVPLLHCRFLDLGKATPLLLPHILKEELEKIAESNKQLQEGPAYALLLTGQEVIVTQGLVAIALRPDIGVWKYITVNPSDMKIETVTASKYLGLKENLSGQRKPLQPVYQLAAVLHCPHLCRASVACTCTTDSTNRCCCSHAVLSRS